MAGRCCWPRASHGRPHCQGAAKHRGRPYRGRYARPRSLPADPLTVSRRGRAPRSKRQRGAPRRPLAGASSPALTSRSDPTNGSGVGPATEPDHTFSRFGEVGIVLEAGVRWGRWRMFRARRTRTDLHTDRFQSLPAAHVATERHLCCCNQRVMDQAWAVRSLDSWGIGFGFVAASLRQVRRGCRGEIALVACQVRVVCQLRWCVRGGRGAR